MVGGLTDGIDLYHLYYDELFWYEVVLTRDNQKEGIQERYEMSVS
jgi:hypothetical protein